MVRHEKQRCTNESNDLYKASYRLADSIAQAARVDIIVYAGKTGELGFYDPNTDTIHLNLNGMNKNGKSMMAFTLGHELVHRANNGSPAKYQAFADFLVENYGKRGADLDAMIAQQLAAAKRYGKKMTRDQAFEEVVCDACQRMLLDTNAGEKLAQFGAESRQNKGILSEIKGWIEEFMQKLREIFAGVEPDSLAAKEFAKFDDGVKQILADMYVDMTVDAGEKLGAKDKKLGAEDKARLKHLREDGDSFALPKSDQAYMDAVERGDMETAQRMVNERAEQLRADVFAQTDVPTYRVRRGPTPKKTITVYKVFTMSSTGKPSALFVSSNFDLPVGVWLDAQDTYHFTDQRNGHMYVPSTKNPNTKGGATGRPTNVSDISAEDIAELEKRGYLKRDKNGNLPKTITSLAYRPGWHAGDLPFFPQGGMQIDGSNYPNVHRYNQVVFECEMIADNDYTDYHVTDDGNACPAENRACSTCLAAVSESSASKRAPQRRRTADPRCLSRTLTRLYPH